MKSIGRGAAASQLAAWFMVMLTGCASFGGSQDEGPRAPISAKAAPAVVAGSGPTLGPPYRVGDVTYTPADIPDYDDVGFASLYSDQKAGKLTASGEAYDAGAITAAHKTLPLPSFVEVTDLDTGRTILVRVNDRGPMANDRLIELSPGAASQLGLKNAFTAVRVRRTNPPTSEKAHLRAGRPVSERIATPDSLLVILRHNLKQLPAPKPAAGSARPAPMDAPAAAPVASAKSKPGSDRFVVENRTAKTPPASDQQTSAAAAKSYVQVAAFSSETRANAAARPLGARVVKSGNLWRVQMGPFATDGETEAALAKARAAGYHDALVLRDR